MNWLTERALELTISSLSHNTNINCILIHLPITSEYSAVNNVDCSV